MRYGWFVVVGMVFLISCSKHSDTAYARLIQLLPPRAQVVALADVQSLHLTGNALFEQLTKLPVCAHNPALMQLFQQLKHKTLQALSAFWSPLGVDWQTDLQWAALGLDLSGQHQDQALLAFRGHFPDTIEEHLVAAAKREQKLGHAVYWLDQTQDLVLVRLDSEYLVIGQSDLALVALARWVDGLARDDSDFVHQGFHDPAQASFKMRLSFAAYSDWLSQILSEHIPRLRTLGHCNQIALDWSKRVEISVYCQQEQYLSDARLFLESLEQIAQSAVQLTQAWAYWLLASDIDALDVLPQHVQQVLENRSALLQTLPLLEPKSAMGRILPLGQSQTALRLEGDEHLLLQLGILGGWVWLMPEVSAGLMAQ